MATQPALQILPGKEKAAPQPPGFAEILAASAKAEKPKAKKETMPTLDPPADVKDAVDLYQTAKAERNKADADMAASGEVIMAWTQEKADEDGYSGNPRGSYCLRGNSHQVKVIYANKFSINPSDKGALAQIVGESFADLFNESFQVKLKPEVFENEALQNELMALVGARWHEFFETSVALSVKEGFSKDIYRYVGEDDMGNLRLFCRQYKPSLR